MLKTKVKLNRANIGIIIAMILAVAVFGFWPTHRQDSVDNPVNSVHAVTPTDIAVFQAVMEYAKAPNDFRITYQRTTTPASEFAGGTGREDLLKQIYGITDDAIARTLAMEKAMVKRNAKSVPIPNFAVPSAANRSVDSFEFRFTLPAYTSDGSEALIYCNSMFFSVRKEYGEWVAQRAIEEQTPGIHASF